MLIIMPGPNIVRITILAATRMYNGICVAGVDQSRDWTRPVRLPEFNFDRESLSERDEVVVEPYNEIEFRITRMLDDSPQSEDCQIDRTRAPHLVRTISDPELTALMKSLDEYDTIERQKDKEGVSKWLTNLNRSLALTRVDKVLKAYRGSSDYDRRPRRLIFRVGNATFDMPCTDLRWRYMTRGDRDDECTRSLNSAHALYFALGLTRLFQGRYWPMVVGIHPIPRLSGEVDYDRL